jgi:hypothetical protein
MTAAPGPSTAQRADMPSWRVVKDRDAVVKGKPYKQRGLPCAEKAPIVVARRTGRVTSP